VTVQPRRRNVERFARIYDDQIAPCWGAPFGKLLLRDLCVPPRGQVLDVSCGTGDPAIEILRRMTDGSRLIAIDESSAMLDVVRRKVAALGPLGRKGVFFRTESAVPRLSFADDVYDLVVCNLAICEMPSLESALCDFARVAKPGGEVRCTLPLAGTFAEFHDLYREVLVKHDRHDALERLELHLARYPTSDEIERCIAAAGMTGGIEIEEFSLLFRSAREFFFAPVIEYGPLTDWKRVAGTGQDLQEVFWDIKEAIDAYFGTRAFQVTVRAGLVIGKKPLILALGSAPDYALDPDDLPVESVTRPLRRVDDLDDDPDDSSFDHIDTGLPWPPHDIADGSARTTDAALDELAAAEAALDEEAQSAAEFDALASGRKPGKPLVD